MAEAPAAMFDEGAIDVIMMVERVGKAAITPAIRVCVMRGSSYSIRFILVWLR